MVAGAWVGTRRAGRWAFIVAVGLFSMACGGGADEDGGEMEAGAEAEVEAGAQAELEVVPIGYIGPLSGGAAYYGRNVQRGLEMAVGEIETAGGFDVGGRRVTFDLTSADDRYLPFETTLAARRLLQRQQTRVIFVPHAGGIRALQEMNLTDPQFLLMAYSSEPSILERDNPLMVMLPPRFDGYQEPFARVMMERFGNRLALLGTTTAYGTAWTVAITEEWQRQGGTVGRNNGVDYNTTTDFTGAVSRALADDPDVLFIGGPSQPTALVIRAAREQGFQGGFLIMDQAKFMEMLQIVSMDDLEGSIGVFPQEIYPTPGAPFFVERYYERYGDDAPSPTSEIAINYQGVHLLAKAMELAGTTDDPAAIRAAMDEAAQALPADLRIFEMVGVTEAGHLSRAVYAAHIVNGEFVPVEIPAPGADPR